MGTPPQICKIIYCNNVLLTANKNKRYCKSCTEAYRLGYMNAISKQSKKARKKRKEWF